MSKFIKFIFVLTTIIFIGVLVLSYGITTSKFNDPIKKEVEKQIPNSELKFNTTSVSLDVKKFKIKIGLNEPALKIENQTISIQSFKIFLNIFKFFQQEYIVDAISLSFSNQPLDVISKLNYTKAHQSFVKKIISGDLNGELTIEIKSKEKLNYNFDGSLKNLTININDKLPYVRNLKTDITLTDYKVQFTNFNAKFADLDLKSNDLKYGLFTRNLLGDIELKGVVSDATNLKEIIKFFPFLDVPEISNLQGFINLKNSLNINFDENYFVKSNKSEVNTIINNLQFDLKHPIQVYQIRNFNTKFLIDSSKKTTASGSFEMNKYLANFDISKEHNTDFYTVNLNSKANLKNLFFPKQSFFLTEDINFNIKSQFKDFNHASYQVRLDLKDTEIDSSFFNYKKNKGIESDLKLNLVFNEKKIFLRDFIYQSQKDELTIKKINLNNMYQIDNFDEIYLKLKNNDFSIVNKNKNYIIKGKSLDLSRFLAEKISDSSEIDFSRNFNGTIMINLNRILLPDEFLKNYSGKGNIKQGKFYDYKSSASFSDDTKFKQDILTNKKNHRENILYSDKAKPFLASKKFLSGLSKGNLEVIVEDIGANAALETVKIKKFYIKDMPVLANILSVASITGILDTLKGKGVYFDEAVVKYHYINKKIEIIECYGTGPSLGFILEGYVNPDGYVKMSGSLAPANLINEAIKSIPIVGSLITGKKGDGLFGASFKIKGPENKLETEVNPIRTLTPRFIQRFVDLFRGK